MNQNWVGLCIHVCFFSCALLRWWGAFTRFVELPTVVPHHSYALFCLCAKQFDWGARGGSVRARNLLSYWLDTRQACRKP